MQIQISPLMDFFSHLGRFMTVVAVVRSGNVLENRQGLKVEFCQTPTDFLVGLEVRYILNDKPMRRMRLFVHPMGSFELAGFYEGAQAPDECSKIFEISGDLALQELAANPAAAANAFGLDLLDWLQNNHAPSNRDLVRPGFRYTGYDNPPATQE